jgi:mono/diheme cytochrome c family protein
MKFLALLCSLAVIVTCAPVPAGETALTSGEAAGRVLFEEAAGDVGCQACHGPDATGTELAPDIRGADEVAIIRNLKINGNMGFLALSTEEIEALAAYLAFLRDYPLR